MLTKTQKYKIIKKLKTKIDGLLIVKFPWIKFENHNGWQFYIIYFLFAYYCSSARLQYETNILNYIDNNRERLNRVKVKKVG